MRRDSRRKQAATFCCRARTGKPHLAAFCSGSKRPTKRRTRFFPAGSAQHLPDGTYRFANEPHDARLAALRSRSGFIASPATARPRRARSSSICRKASIATILPASSTRDTGARSDQYAGKRHGSGAARTGGAQARRAPRRRHQRRRRRRAVGAEFSAHSRCRPRRHRRAAADRHDLGAMPIIRA